MTGGTRGDRFRAGREAGWTRLEGLVAHMEQGSLALLSDADLLALPGLYRSTLSALSVARATSLDRGMVEYLEGLSARAYFQVYGARTPLGRRLLGFFAVGWPRAAQAVWRETLVAWALLAGGAVLAAVLVTGDADWFHAFVPDGLAGGRDPSATTQDLRDALYSAGDQQIGLFATHSFIRNAQIAVSAFALGLLFCLPTALLLAYAGATAGALGAVFHQHGLGVGFGGWLLAHGVTELAATVLAGAAGFRIGAAVAMPGPVSRVAAMAAAGRQAATLMAGVFVMLLCAGVLEGVVQQAVRGDAQRYALAALSAAAWLLYLHGPRRGQA